MTTHSLHNLVLLVGVVHATEADSAVKLLTWLEPDCSEWKFTHLQSDPSVLAWVALSILNEEEHSGHGDCVGDQNQQESVRNDSKQVGQIVSRVASSSLLVLIQCSRSRFISRKRHQKEKNLLSAEN